MNWSNKWDESFPIIPPAKPKTSEIMRQNNLLADEVIALSISKSAQKNLDVIKEFCNTSKLLNEKLEIQHFILPETIEAIDKPDEVDCIVVGDLGIYEKHDKWNVLHIPTLLHFNRAVPHVEPTLEQLIDWCKLVQADHREDWEALKQFGLDLDKDVTVELRQRILRHCQMIDIKE